MTTMEPPAIPVPDAEHPSTLNGQVSGVRDTPTVTGRSATEIASEEAFLDGLDQLVQRLANDASAMWQGREISRAAFHDLITNYTHLWSQIRFRRRDLKKNELHPDR